MSKYSVLWFDDQFDSPELQEIADKAFDKYSIELHGYKSAVEGLKNIEIGHFDAILLDARFYINDANIAGSEDLKGLRIVWNRLTQLEGQGILIPKFILSGQTKLDKDDTFLETYGKFYSKHDSDEIDKLFRDIICEADKRFDTQIRHKYQLAFDVCNEKYIGEDNRDRLLRILSGVENNDNKNPSYFNEIRKVIEDVFACCNDKGLFPIDCTGITPRSKHLGSTEMEPYVPSYIQRNIHSVVKISQEGSHRLLIDSDVTSGKSPFLLISTTFELLNVLLWLKDFIDGNPIGVDDKIWIKGEIIKIANGYGTFKPLNGEKTISIHPRTMNGFNLQENQLIEITTKPDPTGTKTFTDQIRLIQ